MNVAIWLLTALFALPLAEIVVFVLVAVWIGFGWAALALLATTLAGSLILRQINQPGGGNHIARIKTALGPQRVTALEADGPGTMTILAGILLLIPGFITDVIGILLLIPPLRRGLGALLLRALTGSAQKREGVVDLEPQEWRQMPDAQLRDERDRQRGPRAAP